MCLKFTVKHQRKTIKRPKFTVKRPKFTDNNPIRTVKQSRNQTNYSKTGVAVIKKNGFSNKNLKKLQ